MEKTSFTPSISWLPRCLRPDPAWSTVFTCPPMTSPSRLCRQVAAELGNQRQGTLSRCFRCAPGPVGSAARGWRMALVQGLVDQAPAA